MSTLAWLHATGAYDLKIMLAEGGDLLPEFEGFDPDARVLNLQQALLRWSALEKALSRAGLDRTRLRVRARRLRASQADLSQSDLVYVNSAASLAALPGEIGSIPVVFHAHELEFTMRASLPGELFDRLTTMPDHIIAVSEPVAETLVRVCRVPRERITLIPAFLDAESRATPPRPTRRTTPPMVLACGTVEWRKGPDLFLQVALAHRRLFPGSEVEWVWLGSNPCSESLNEQFRSECSKSGLDDCLTVVPSTSDIHRWFDRCALFLLTSREDPYPLVVLEAARAGKPAICFDHSGGMPEFLSRGAGVVVPYGDVLAMAQETERLLKDEAVRGELGATGRHLVETEHTVLQAGPRIQTVIDSLLPRRESLTQTEVTDGALKR